MWNNNKSFLVTALPPLPTDGSELEGGQTACILFDGMEKEILAQSSFPRPLPVSPSNPPSFHIGNSPGAGLGMFATTDIATGDIVVSERPLLVITRIMPTEEAIAEAMKLVRPAYFTLANCKGSGCSQGLGIARTNGFGAETLPNGGGSFIVEFGSRCNHRQESSIISFMARCFRAERNPAAYRAQQKFLISLHSPPNCGR